MKTIQILTLLVIGMLAALSDLRSGTIPNPIVAAGLAMGFAWQLVAKGALGVPLFLGGVLLPLLLFGVFYYFRMIGAGDVKLLCAVGGFLGPIDCFSCIVCAVFFGGILSLALLFRRGNALGRLRYFADYVAGYARTGEWRSYLAGAEDSARFCFSVPVLFALFCYVGGLY